MQKKKRSAAVVPSRQPTWIVYRSAKKGRVSQNWPFPSQMMIGFVATYAGGDVVVDREELDDARWFPCGALPNLPSRHSISRYIIDHYGQP